jgi:DNA-binding transcriptional LysR family regulator
MMGAYLFPKIFSSFQKRYSHLEIFLHEEASMSIREQLERDELDFGIIIISGASQSLQLLPMTRSQIVCCVPETSPLARKKSISLQDVTDSSMVMLKEGSFLRQAILSRMKDENITPNIVLESNQVVTLKGLVASGVGIAFLLNMVVEDTPGVKAIPLADPLIVDVGLAWKKDRYISKAAQSFIDFCKDLLKERNAKAAK